MGGGGGSSELRTTSQAGGSVDLTFPPNGHSTETRLFDLNAFSTPFCTPATRCTWPLSSSPRRLPRFALPSADCFPLSSTPFRPQSLSPSPPAATPGWQNILSRIFLGVALASKNSDIQRRQKQQRSMPTRFPSSFFFLGLFFQPKHLRKPRFASFLPSASFSVDFHSLSTSLFPLAMLVPSVALVVSLASLVAASPSLVTRNNGKNTNSFVREFYEFSTSLLFP